MNKYLLFAGSNYYPKGGWDDFKTSSDSLEELHELGKEKVPNPHRHQDKYDWYHIVDSETRTTVFNSDDK